MAGTTHSRVGRPFGGRKREEMRRANRQFKARNPTPSRKHYGFSVSVNSSIHERLKDKKDKSQYIRDCISQHPALLKETLESRRIIRNLERTLKEWGESWELDRHALGLHSEQPVRGCAACEEN